MVLFAECFQHSALRMKCGDIRTYNIWTCQAWMLGICGIRRRQQNDSIVLLQFSIIVGAGIQKADSLSENTFRKTVCYFHFLLFVGERRDGNLGKIFFPEASKDSKNELVASSSPTWWKKQGFGIYGKTLYFLDPQTCKKPRNFPGFWGRHLFCSANLQG